MKPSTVVLVTAILLAGTLVFPWTEVTLWAPGRASLSGRSIKEIPYPFFYEAERTSTKILWDKTFIMLGAIAVVGGGLYIKARPKAQALEEPGAKSDTRQ